MSLTYGVVNSTLLHTCEDDGLNRFINFFYFFLQNTVVSNSCTFSLFKYTDSIFLVKKKKKKTTLLVFLNYWWLVISMLPILPSHFPFWLILKKGFYSTSSNSNKTSTNYKVQYTSFFFFFEKKKYNTHQFYYFSYTKTPHPEVEHN